jgi:hypothetical protein
VQLPLNEEVRKALVEYRDEVLSKARPNDMSPDGAVPVHFGAGHREHVSAMVSAPRLRRLLKSQREEDVHHQRGPEDLDGRRVAE